MIAFLKKTTICTTILKDVLLDVKCVLLSLPTHTFHQNNYRLVFARIPLLFFLISNMRHSLNKLYKFPQFIKSTQIFFKYIYILVKQTTLPCCNFVECMVVTNLVRCSSLICIPYPPQTYNNHTYILKNFPSQYLSIRHTCSPLDWTILCHSNWLRPLRHSQTLNFRVKSS